MFDLDGTENKGKYGHSKSRYFFFLVDANLCNYLKNHAMNTFFTAIEINIEQVMC